MCSQVGEAPKSRDDDEAAFGTDETFGEGTDFALQQVFLPPRSLRHSTQPPKLFHQYKRLKLTWSSTVQRSPFQIRSPKDIRLSSDELSVPR